MAGKIETNRHNGDKLRAQMVQVEAVIKMLDPDFSVAAIAAKHRNKSNPWFKRGTLFRSAVDGLRRAGTPMTAREIAAALIADKAARQPRASHRPTAGHPCRTAEAGWWRGGWRGIARALGIGKRVAIASPVGQN